MWRHRWRNELRGFVFLESQIRDDRGRWRTAPKWRTFSGDGVSSLEPERRESIRRAFKDRCTSSGGRWLRPAPWWSIAASIAAAAAIVLFVPGANMRFVLLVIVAIVLLADLRARRWLSWPDVMALRDTLLRHRVCAHCAFPLDSVNSDDEGRVVCPECGSAWRL